MAELSSLMEDTSYAVQDADSTAQLPLLHAASLQCVKDRYCSSILAATVTAHPGPHTHTSKIYIFFCPGGTCVVTVTSYKIRKKYYKNVAVEK